MSWLSLRSSAAGLTTPGEPGPAALPQRALPILPQARSAGTILLKRQAPGQRAECHYSLLGSLSKASGPLSHVPQGLRAQSSHSSLSYVCPFRGSSVTGSRTRGATGFYFEEPGQENACAGLVAAGSEANPPRLICGGKGERGL